MAYHFCCYTDKNIDNYVAVDITGCSTDELYNYLNNKVPIITWVTSGFVTPTNDGTWKVGKETITWCNHEHCLVTTGYDKNAGTVTYVDANNVEVTLDDGTVEKYELTNTQRIDKLTKRLELINI